ncbi:hypothetical protein E2C01_067642 [Portunus trituberculatus]|uniref:Uncharacterized protein n=1 Tax=Portunus trituberculatus TaxID=210409 RepID=A0A5B7HU76_PORTR|nr:hypothetical protein [Portunus trituberculatus]
MSGPRTSHFPEWHIVLCAVGHGRKCENSLDSRCLGVVASSTESSTKPRVWNQNQNSTRPQFFNVLIK